MGHEADGCVTRSIFCNFMFHTENRQKLSDSQRAIRVMAYLKFRRR